MNMNMNISLKYDNVHIKDGYISDISNYEQSKKLEINFKYGIESTIIFFVSKLDKKTIKKLMKILKNTPVFDTEDGNENIIFLNKNGNALYNKTSNEFIFRFDNSKNQSIIYNSNTCQISFIFEDGQYCKICQCTDCEYYSKFSPSVNIKIPFKDDTKYNILQLFTDIIEIIDIF
jgi:hypothetical protein